MSILLKKFVLKHTFANVSNMEEAVYVYSDEEEHFGVPWKTYIVRKDGHLSFILYCPKPLEVGKWSIDTEFELKIISKTEKVMKRECLFGNTTANNISASGWSKFIDWEEMKRDYLANDKLDVEAHVTIKKMTGFYGKQWRWFDDNAKDVTDFVITVGNQNFNVSKFLLASLSPYLKPLVLEQFKAQNRFSFNQLDPDDFQKYLEALYGDASIDENTVEGIVLIADLTTTNNVIRRCEEFLIDKSKKSLKKKLQMATRYNLPQLKKHCLASMKSNADVRSVVPSDISKMDREWLETLFQKLLSID